MRRRWLTGEIGIQPARSRRDEIMAIIKSLEYAQSSIDYSNFDVGNIEKAITLVKSQLTKRKPGRSFDYWNEH